MQRYWDAETTPEEELELARYATRVDDPDFEEVRGVLGFLSIGREKTARRTRLIRLYSFAAIAAAIVVIIVSGLSILQTGYYHRNEICVQYSYGNISHDNKQIMSTVESSLEDFFTEKQTR